MLWAIFGVMLLVAASAIVWPLWRIRRRLDARAMVLVAALAVGCGLTYNQIGQPEARFTAAVPDSVDAMVESLAARLEQDPTDIEGWKMLGRSYTVMRRFDEAVAALERAVALEDSANGQTLADLGEAIFLGDNRALQGRAGELFESSLALVPGNPKALFYSGLAAAERGDEELAAERWEALLATSPPPEITSVLEQRIAEWRGQPAPSPGPLKAAAANDVSVDVDVALGEAAATLGPDTTVFIIARDPAQPSPPVAVARRLAEELPTRVTLTDADAMLPGRPLSAFSTLEIVARASVGGQPMPQSGDWFGEATVNLAGERSASIRIDRQVP